MCNRPRRHEDTKVHEVFLEFTIPYKGDSTPVFRMKMNAS